MGYKKMSGSMISDIIGNKNMNLPQSRGKLQFRHCIPVFFPLRALRLCGKFFYFR